MWCLRLMLAGPHYLTNWLQLSQASPQLTKGWSAEKESHGRADPLAMPILLLIQSVRMHYSSCSCCTLSHAGRCVINVPLNPPSWCIIGLSRISASRKNGSEGAGLLIWPPVQRRDKCLGAISIFARGRESAAVDQHSSLVPVCPPKSATLPAWAGRGALALVNVSMCEPDPHQAVSHGPDALLACVCESVCVWSVCVVVCCSGLGRLQQWLTRHLFADQAALIKVT